MASLFHSREHVAPGCRDIQAPGLPLRLQCGCSMDGGGRPWPGVQPLPPGQEAPWPESRADLSGGSHPQAPVLGPGWRPFPWKGRAELFLRNRKRWHGASLCPPLPRGAALGWRPAEPGAGRGSSPGLGCRLQVHTLQRQPPAWGHSFPSDPAHNQAALAPGCRGRRDGGPSPEERDGGQE